MSNRNSLVFIVVAALAVILSACGSPTPTITPQPAATNTTEPSATTAAATSAATVAASEAATSAATIAASEASTSAATEAGLSSLAATSAATMASTGAATEATSAATGAAVAMASGTAASTAASTTAAPAQETAAAVAPSTLPTCNTGTGVLKVGSDASYPPFETVSESTNAVQGFDVDLLNAIGQKAGFTTDFHNALFDTIFTALSYGQYDVVISASTITDARKQTVNFSNPYFESGQRIIVRKADASTVKVPADLAGKAIGVQLGTTGAEAAKGIQGTKSVKEYPTAPEAFQALSNGDVDAVINDDAVSLNILLNSPALNLVAVGTTFTTEYYGIAIRKECTDLLTKINTGLSAVIADGTYATIYEKYFGSSPSSEMSAGGTGLTMATASASGAATMSATAAATVAPTTAAAAGGGAIDTVLETPVPLTTPTP